MLRYLFGLTGTAPTNGTFGAGAGRTDPAAIATFLTNILPELDIDGDGRVDALTDQIMYIRYLFGLRGPSLIQGAVSGTATQTTSGQSEAYSASIVN